MAEDALSLEQNKVARQIFIAIGVFAVVLSAGTLAYRLDGWELGDAFYMVIITAFGVGFGEIHPIITTADRTITIVTILAGHSATVFVVGSLIKVITEGEMQKAMSDHRKQRHVSELRGHTIICGYGRIGQTVAHELQKVGKPFIVIDREPERTAMAERDGYLTLTGDGGDEELLSKANLDHAHTLAAVLPNDTVNVFITLTSRNMSASLRIIARAENPATEKKLRQAGANDVIMPAFSGGMQIAHRISRPSLAAILQDSSQLLRFDLQELGVDLEEVPIQSGSHLVGAPISDFLAANAGRSIILAVQRADGESIQHPREELKLQADDRLILLRRR